MRKLKPLLPFLLLVSMASTDLFSQAALGIFAQDLVAVPSTVNYGDSVKYSFSVENKGDSAYTGMIGIWVEYDGGNGTQDIYDFFVSNLQPNSSLPLLVPDGVILSKYDIGGNVVVIWPKADNPQVPTVDSAWTEVTVADTPNGLGEELLKRVKVGPNPSHGTLRLQYEGYKNELEYVSLTNIHGKQLLFSEEVVHSIDLSRQPFGIYFLELSFKDGLKGTYRILLDQ